MVAGPSDMFGELSIFDPGPRTSTATAVTEVRAYTMDRTALREWIGKRPEIAEQLLRVLARRLRRTNNMLADLIFTDVPGRVAKALLQLARQFGSQESGLLRVTHDLTQEEIAQLVGASPGDGEQGARRLRAPRLAAAGGQERADPRARAAGPPRSLTRFGVEEYSGTSVPEYATLDGVSSTSSLPHAESASLSAYRAALTAPGAAAPALFSALGPPAGRHVRAGDAALRPGRDGLVRRGRAGVGRLARRVSRSGRSRRDGWWTGSVPTRPLLAAAVLFAGAAAALIAAVERGRAAGRWWSGRRRSPEPSNRRCPARPARCGAGWCRPGACATRRLQLRGDQHGGLLHPRAGPGGVAGRGAVARHRAWSWRRWRRSWARTGFALTSAVRATTPAVRSGPLGMLGALALPGVLTVALAGLGFGLVVGGVEVGVPAVAAEAGSRILGGMLISAWSVVSVLAGLLYALRPWPRPLHLRLPVLLGAFGVLVAAMAAAGSSLVGLTIVMLVAGAVITPQVTAQSLALEVATPAGTATEAFGWVITAITLGVAAGQSVDRVAGGAVRTVGGLPGRRRGRSAARGRPLGAPAHARPGSQPRRRSAPQVLQLRPDRQLRRAPQHLVDVGVDVLDDLPRRRGRSQHAQRRRAPGPGAPRGARGSARAAPGASGSSGPWPGSTVVPSASSASRRSEPR